MVLRARPGAGRQGPAEVHGDATLADLVFVPAGGTPQDPQFPQVRRRRLRWNHLPTLPHRIGNLTANANGPSEPSQTTLWGGTVGR